MAELSAEMKGRITEALDATTFRQRGFRVSYGGGDDALAAIARSEYRFVIGSAGTAFTTGEFPGIKTYETETFQRSDFESCVRAIRDWAERILDREESDILDQFGGVADRNPSLPTK